MMRALLDSARMDGPERAGRLARSPRPTAAVPGARTAMRIAIATLLLACTVGAAQAQVEATTDYLSRMDGDGDGKVSLDEYLAWMSYAFDARDRNGDGTLAGDELPGGRGNPIPRQQHRERLAATFHKQDADRDGYLSARELAAPPR